MYGLPESALSVFNAGHLVENHTFDHTDLATLSDAQITAQFQQTSDAIFNITGARPEYFRPPYGSMDASVQAIAQAMNLKTTLWTVDTNDWQQGGINGIVQSALSGATDAAGQRAGSFGQLACFSFYYAKNLGAYGEAGAITTSDPELERRVRLLRSHGEEARYQHTLLGFNSRPDEIQCAVLRIKLRHLDAWNSLRRQHAATYDRLLADVPVERPENISSGEHVYHLYVIRAPARDELRTALNERGVATGVHYPLPVHLQPACRELGYVEGSLPETERVAREVVSLPMYPELTADQVEFVAEALRAALPAEVRG